MGGRAGSTRRAGTRGLPEPRPRPARLLAPRSPRSQIGMADTMKAFPKKSADDLAERLRLKSCKSRSSSDCCLKPPLGAMAEPGSAQARSRAGANSGHLWTAPTAAAPNQRSEEVGLIRERLPGIGRYGAVVNPVRLGERARLPDSRTLPDTSASVKR